MIKIVEAKNSGFCFGVKSAVETAFNYADKDAFTFGKIIHSERILDKLKARGVRIINSVDDIPDGVTNATVILRSHGVGKKVYEDIRRRGLTLVDATCPFVKKIHRIVEQHYRDGYRIVIIGAAEHPEVKGINGWCEDSAVVIDEDYDVSKLTCYEKLCFVSQTTFSVEKYSEIIKKIRKQPYKTVEIFDTICYTTSGRQNEVRRLASVCDKVLVLGSLTSSNTRKLYQLACLGRADAYAVTCLDDLINIKFGADDVTGVIAGASTPDELITEVKEYMSGKFGAEIQDSEFLKAVEDTLVTYKDGKRVTGTVITADEKGVQVAIGGKKDGLIRPAEVNMDGSYDPKDFTEGMELEVKIIKTNDQESGCILLSKKAIDEIKEMDKVIDTIRNGERFELKIDKSVEKGLTARLGTYNVFIPQSQVEERYVKDLKKYVGKTLTVVVIDIDDSKHKIIASHRVVAEADRKAKEDIFWENVVPNMIVSGVVKRTTNFGAFVSVDGFDCLAHIVDLSWTHINTVEEVLTVGQTYEFVVLKADREANRVSLGYKQLQPHPFVACMEKHPVGSTLVGKITSIVPFGVFVEVEPHLEGLVHVSEVAHTYVKNVSDVVKVGDEVEVKVLSYDEAARKINLSIKACLPEEEKPEGEKEAKAEKKARKPRVQKEKTDSDSSTGWSEDTSNNPFADLLKDLDIK